MSKDQQSELLRNELKSLADTLEEVLNSSSDKSKAESALKDTRSRLSETGERIVNQTKEAADYADDYVLQNPWTGVGIGAVVGVVLGVLLARG
ncbi:DUF883 family protein [Candidatus Symbiopectobacterium endolongispinus]|uniref:DUF883 family protein n=1 Tax=Candidatus Symbiopectobacterium endolongispinus TaxID=2812664 RepID=UPI002079CA14|nr:hypothetical protein [Candidatus Symbiopectobacterium endolongispinus]MBT9430891.1 DUF883 family protein [Candidatus Symbiopectobacterium endolongispinus]